MVRKMRQRPQIQRRATHPQLLISRSAKTGLEKRPRETGRDLSAFARDGTLLRFGADRGFVREYGFTIGCVGKMSDVFGQLQEKFLRFDVQAGSKLIRKCIQSSHRSVIQRYVLSFIHFLHFCIKHKNCCKMQQNAEKCQLKYKLFLLMQKCPNLIIRVNIFPFCYPRRGSGND